MVQTILNQKSVSVASYPTYEGAMDALAYLRGHEFPVQFAEIVAEKVKEVTDRPVVILATIQLFKAAVLSALTGGLLVFTLVYFNFLNSTTTTLWNIVIYGAGLGACIGLVLETLNTLLFGVARRPPHYTAEAFDVTVHEQYMQEAQRLLQGDDLNYKLENDVGQFTDMHPDLTVRTASHRR